MDNNEHLTLNNVGRFSSFTPDNHRLAPPPHHQSSSFTRQGVIISGFTPTNTNKEYAIDDPKEANMSRLSIIVAIIVSIVSIIGTLIGATWFISSKINDSANDSRKEVMSMYQNDRVELSNKLLALETKIDSKFDRVNDKVDSGFKDINNSLYETKALISTNNQKTNK